MNAVYIRKRNRSLQWILACLAAGELLAWIWSGINIRGEAAESYRIIVSMQIMLMLTIFLLVIAVLVHYVLACAYYVNAKGRDNAPLLAVCALLSSLLGAWFCLLFAGACNNVWAAYFAIPAVFALGAVPLKLMQDRSVTTSVESLP